MYSGLTEETKELRGKIVEIEKSNALAKSTSAKERSKKWSTIAEKRSIAPEAKLKEDHDAQKQNVDAAKHSNRRATDAAAQPEESILRITKVEENAKVAAEKLVDIERQVTGSSIAAEGALGRFIDASNCVKLLVKETQVLNFSLAKW